MYADSAHREVRGCQIRPTETFGAVFGRGKVELEESLVAAVRPPVISQCAEFVANADLARRKRLETIRAHLLCKEL